MSEKERERERERERKGGRAGERESNTVRKERGKVNKIPTLKVTWCGTGGRKDI